MLSPKSGSAGFRSLLLGLAAALWLAACNTVTEEAPFLDVKVDTTWTRYDRLMVVLADTAGAPRDTLFDGRLHSVDQLSKLDAAGYDGGKVQVILIGFLDDKEAKRETRPFDGRTGASGDKIVVILIPVGPGGPAALDLKPDAATLYTGGGDLALAPSGPEWDGVDLQWTSSRPSVATVAAGKVVPVAPGKAWIRAAASGQEDSSEITVVTDAPVLEAGGDTVVLIQTTVAFRVKVRQEHGVYAMFKWSLDGDTLWDDSTSDIPASATVFTAPARTFAAADTVDLRFLVRDGEGNAVTAGRQVIVARQAPKITSLLEDAEIRVGDSVAFSAQAEVSPGQLRKFAWDFGDSTAGTSGALSAAKAALAAGHRFARSGEFKVSLTVEDDLGNRVSSSVTVKVLADANADLKALVLSAGALAPAFSPGITAYAAGVANGVSGLTLTPTAAGEGATVKVNGAAVASGSPSVRMPLAVGANVFNVEVTAQSGLKKTYTVTVTRAGSAANTLSALTASAGALSPAFAAGTLAYTVATKDTLTTLTATLPAGSQATLKVNGAAAASGTASAPIRLPSGETTTIPVAVTAQDGTVRTYSIAFVVGPAGKPDLAITGVTLTSKTPTRVNYSYTLVNKGTAPIADLHGVSIQNYYSADTVFNNAGDVAAGGAILGITKPLAPGETHTGTFSASGAVPAGLPYLTFKVDWGDTVDESDETNNTAARRVLVAPVAQAGADTTVAAASSVRLRGKAADALGSIAKTEWKIGAAAFAAAPPETTFAAPAVGGVTLACILRVTDDDGLTDEDTVRVTVTASADADLASLVPSAGTLSPAFARATTAYTLSLGATVSSLTLTPTAVSPAATIRVNGLVVANGAASGSLPLAVGANTLVVAVTAQSGLLKTYTVTATRAGSTVNTLSALTASAGTLSPAFAAGVLAYTVNTATASTTVTPTVTAGSGATVTVNGVAVASGSPSAPIPTPAGIITTVNIAVTSQSGAVRTYSIAFNRPGANLPDLEVTAFAITSVSATRVEYTYTIRNRGGTTIPSIFDLDIQNFYSNDQVFNNAGDKAAGGSILGVNRALAPGESYTGTYAASGSPTGFKFVTWKIDWSDGIAESDEDNNTVAMPL